MFRLFVWQSICFQLFPWAAALCVSALQAPTNPTQNSTDTEEQNSRASLLSPWAFTSYLAVLLAALDFSFEKYLTQEQPCPEPLSHSILLVTLSSNRGHSEFDRWWRPAIPVFSLSPVCLYSPLSPPSQPYILSETAVFCANTKVCYTVVIL